MGGSIGPQVSEDMSSPGLWHCVVGSCGAGRRFPAVHPEQERVVLSMSVGMCSISSDRAMTRRRSVGEWLRIRCHLRVFVVIKQLRCSYFDIIVRVNCSCGVVISRFREDCTHAVFLGSLGFFSTHDFLDVTRLGYVFFGQWNWLYRFNGLVRAV